MPKYFTSRNFPVYEEFTDNRGNEIYIQHSSSANKPSIWIFCKRNDKDDTPHLNIEDAKKVRDALNEFISAYV